MNEIGVSVKESYATLPDGELDSVVSDIVSEFPKVGCKRMTGLLLNRGLRFQQSRIRESMRRVISKPRSCTSIFTYSALLELYD